MSQDYANHEEPLSDIENAYQRQFEEESEPNAEKVEIPSPSPNLQETTKLNDMSLTELMEMEYEIVSSATENATKNKKDVTSLENVEMEQKDIKTNNIDKSQKFE